MPLKHRFVSDKPDSPDTSLIRPSNWNEDHKVEPGIRGSVLFVGENQSVSEDNANFFWDNIGKRLICPTVHVECVRLRNNMIIAGEDGKVVVKTPGGAVILTIEEDGGIIVGG